MMGRVGSMVRWRAPVGCAATLWPPLLSVHGPFVRRFFVAVGCCGWSGSSADRFLALFCSSSTSNVGPCAARANAVDGGDAGERDDQSYVE
jgi:hypothetical protein